MKKQDKTIVPRKQDLNKALVDLGHKQHSDKRKEKLERDRQQKEKDEYYDAEDEWDD